MWEGISIAAAIAFVFWAGVAWGRTTSKRNRGRDG